MSSLNVRHLRADEADLHRQLRFEALRESPRAFGDTLEPLERKGADYWNALTQRVCSVDVMVVALDGERPIGMIYGLRDRQIRQGAMSGSIRSTGGAAQRHRLGANARFCHGPPLGWT